jgi:anti-sigma B factor antagonist
MKNLSIVTDNTKDIAVMNIKGRVDSDTSPELDSALENLLNSEKNKIVLNLETVDYLSSAGLRALVNALKKAQESGGDLRLAAVSEQIEVIFRTVGMLQMFKMFPSEEEAVASF